MSFLILLSYALYNDRAKKSTHTSHTKLGWATTKYEKRSAKTAKLVLTKKLSPSTESHVRKQRKNAEL